MKILGSDIYLKIRDPRQILALIPHARQQDQHVICVPHEIEETKVLRNLGIPVPAPILTQYHWPGLYAPFDHQQEIAAFCTLHPRNFVLADMGLGKSLAVLWAADHLMNSGVIHKALILSTLSCLDAVWHAELFRHFMHRTSIVVHGSKKQRVDALKEDVDFYILNHHGVKIVDHELAARDDIDLIILDEGSAYRNSQTDMYKTFRKLLRPEQRLWILTGQPCPNGPVDAWALARLVSPGRVPAFYGRWRDDTMLKVSMFKWVPKHDATAKVHQALQPAIRFAKADCLNLPPTLYLDRETQMSREQQKWFSEMKSRMLIYAQNNVITANNAAIMLSKLLQISAGCVRSDDEAYVPLDVSERLATLDEIVDEANAKSVIFVPYTGALHRVLDHMGKRFTVAKIDGSTSRTQRKQIIAAFESTSNPQIIVAHPKTASHGLNLVAADTMIWFSPIHSLDIYGQACERMARPAQKLTTRIVHIGATKVEWGVYAALREKERFQARLFDLFKAELKV